MGLTLKTTKLWRYRHKKLGAQALWPGEYRVPENLAREYADRCVLEGMGEMTETVVELVQEKPRRKKRAPQNKMLNAPENKQAI